MWFKSKITLGRISTYAEWSARPWKGDFREQSRSLVETPLKYVMGTAIGLWGIPDQNNTMPPAKAPGSMSISQDNA